MTAESHEEIYADMTTALKGKLKRELSERAERGLRDFIAEAVIKGVVESPERYAKFKEYLKCRFEHIAMTVGGEAKDGKVTWKELLDAGKAEVKIERDVCDKLVDLSEKDRDTLRRKICEGFDADQIKEATHLNDGR